MLPLNLPLPLSTEITMQSLMKEASNYLDSGRLKVFVVNYYLFQLKETNKKGGK